MPTTSPFTERYLPRKPYATDTFDNGMYRQDRDKALGMRYIETAPLTVCNLLVADLDQVEYDNAVWHVQDRVYDNGEVLPEPNFVTVNRNTGHAHVAWWLSVPATSLRTRSFADDVRRKLTGRLGADDFYTGQVMRNPLHEGQETSWMREDPYSLSSLADHFTARPSATDRRKRKAAHDPGEGRNVALFDRLRDYAYTWWRAAHDTGYAWFELGVEERARELNMELEVPLPHSEVRSIARSVSRWVWSNFNADKFRRIQSQRAQRKQAAAGTHDRYKAALECYDEGGYRVVADTLGLTIPTARKVVSRARVWAASLEAE